MAQFNKETQTYVDGRRKLHDVNMISNKNGDIVTTDNRFPVDIANQTVTIQDGDGSITVDGTVNIGTMPEVALNIDTANPLPVIGTTVNPWGNVVLTVDDDTVQHTSKNRRKVSTFEVTDFGTFRTGKDTRIWDEKVTGTASATHEPYLGMVRLQVGSSAGDQVIRQTKRVQRYIPGRQNEVSMAAIFGTPTTGIRRRFGLFDERDGAFFEDGGDGTYYVVCRRNTASGPVETRVARENWNVDKLDGTGPTGIVANPENIQLMVIEYEWYGAGQVEFNFVIGNNKIPVHQFNHANEIPNTWSSTAALPVRIELTNVAGTAGTHTFYQGSHSFSTEGTTTLLGRQRNISSAITGKSLSSSLTFYPIVAIRMKSSELNSLIIPDAYTGATLDNTSVFIKVIEGATITGGTWVSYSDESPVEYNITATSFTGGDTVDTSYVSAGNMGVQFSFPDRTITQLQRLTTTNLADTSSTFLIAIASTGSNKSGWGSLGWIEVR